MGQVYTSPCASSHRPQRARSPVDVDAVVIGNRHLSADYNVLALDAPGDRRARATRAVRDDQAARAGWIRCCGGRSPIFEILRDAGGRPIGRSRSSTSASASGTSLLSRARGRRAAASASARSAGRSSRRSAGGSLDGRRRRRPRAVRDARRSARRAQDADDALLRRAHARRSCYCVDLFEALGVTDRARNRGRQPRRAGTGHRPARAALRARPLGQPVKLYACGPTPMMRACAQLADRARPRVRRLARTGDGLRPRRLLQLRRCRPHATAARRTTRAPASTAPSSTRSASSGTRCGH